MLLPKYNVGTVFLVQFYKNDKQFNKYQPKLINNNKNQIFW